jgi:hypothetical protein
MHMPDLGNLSLLQILVVLAAIALVIRHFFRRNAASSNVMVRTGGPTTWQEAEQFIAQAMRNLGCLDAQTTPAGADGGIDVTSRAYVAQVKFKSTPIGAPEVQRLFGAAQAQRKHSLFFASSSYTPAALAFAASHVALFTYRPDGKIYAANSFAESLLRTGLQ